MPNGILLQMPNHHCTQLQQHQQHRKCCPIGLAPLAAILYVREQFNKCVDAASSSSEKQFDTVQHLLITASAAENKSVKGSSSRAQTSDSICSSEDEQHNATDEFIAPAIPASRKIRKRSKPAETFFHIKL